MRPAEQITIPSVVRRTTVRTQQAVTPRTSNGSRDARPRGNWHSGNRKGCYTTTASFNTAANSVFTLFLNTSATHSPYFSPLLVGPQTLFLSFSTTETDRTPTIPDEASDPASPGTSFSLGAIAPWSFPLLSAECRFFSRNSSRVPPSPHFSLFHSYLLSAPCRRPSSRFLFPVGGLAALAAVFALRFVCGLRKPSLTSSYFSWSLSILFDNRSDSIRRCLR